MLNVEASDALVHSVKKDETKTSFGNTHCGVRFIRVYVETSAFLIKENIDEDTQIVWEVINSLSNVDCIQCLALRLD
jgi:hypothetical protein